MAKAVFPGETRCISVVTVALFRLASNEREREASALCVQVLGRTRLYLHKHTHADAPTPRYPKRGEINSMVLNLLRSTTGGIYLRSPTLST